MVAAIAGFGVVAPHPGLIGLSLPAVFPTGESFLMACPRCTREPISSYAGADTSLSNLGRVLAT